MLCAAATATGWLVQVTEAGTVSVSPWITPTRRRTWKLKLQLVLSGMEAKANCAAALVRVWVASGQVPCE